MGRLAGINRDGGYPSSSTATGVQWLKARSAALMEELICCCCSTIIIEGSPCIIEEGGAAATSVNRFHC